jgi:hypothetical protein
MRTRLVEPIKHRFDLLAILWRQDLAPKRLHQREIFGAQVLLLFDQVVGQVLNFLVVFLLYGLNFLRGDVSRFAIGLGLSLVATDNADNLLCVRFQLYRAALSK